MARNHRAKHTIYNKWFYTWKSLLVNCPVPTFTCTILHFPLGPMLFHMLPNSMILIYVSKYLLEILLLTSHAKHFENLCSKYFRLLWLWPCKASRDISGLKSYHNLKMFVFDYQTESDWSVQVPQIQIRCSELLGLAVFCMDWWGQPEWTKTFLVLVNMPLQPFPIQTIYI